MLKPLLLRACARCRGDLILEVDEMGVAAYVCLQCGRTATGLAERRAAERSRALARVAAGREQRTSRSQPEARQPAA
ncbi:MAG TPA: hypothetical protein VNN10_09960 [Dehalococcoidia bacterium]|nr:hypothetical protein [Dehalococcoidia bacterium]